MRPKFLKISSPIKHPSLEWALRFSCRPSIKALAIYQQDMRNASSVASQRLVQLMGGVGRRARGSRCHEYGQDYHVFGTWNDGQGLVCRFGLVGAIMAFVFVVIISVNNPRHCWLLLLRD
jgi:hypothetical protein